MAGRNCSLLDLRHDPYPYSGTQKNVLNLSLDYNGLRGCFGSQATIERLERPAVPPFISHGRFIYKGDMLESAITFILRPHLNWH